jgi:hypothetical protein
VSVLERLRFDFRQLFFSPLSLQTMFAYVPRTKPEQPTLLRQIAYRELSPLPGPESDPEGWKTLRPVVSRGLLLPNHPVNIQCTVSIESLDELLN